MALLDRDLVREELAHDLVRPESYRASANGDNGAKEESRCYVQEGLEVIGAARTQQRRDGGDVIIQREEEGRCYGGQGGELTLPALVGSVYGGRHWSAYPY